MNNTPSIQRTALLGVALLFAGSLCAQTSPANAPKVGDMAPNFTLPSMDGNNVELSGMLQRGTTVLVVLRGFPGYQCPICNRQVQEFLRMAPQFAAANAQVLLVYPGPPDGLAGKAKEFMKGKELPEHFTLALDPNYSFTNRYGLRWDAPKETAYPSTFVLDPSGKVMYANVSNSHGGRASAAEVLAAVSRMSGTH